MRILGDGNLSTSVSGTAGPREETQTGLGAAESPTEFNIPVFGLFGYEE